MRPNLFYFCEKIMRLDFGYEDDDGCEACAEWRVLDRGMSPTKLWASDKSRCVLDARALGGGRTAIGVAGGGAAAGICGV